MADPCNRLIVAKYPRINYCLGIDHLDHSDLCEYLLTNTDSRVTSYNFRIFGGDFIRKNFSYHWYHNAGYLPYKGTRHENMLSLIFNTFTEHHQPPSSPGFM